MAIEIMKQTDHYLTEASVAIPASVSEVDDIMKATKSTGKMTVLYNQGGVIGINVEQKSKIPVAQASKVKEILALGETIL